MDDSEQVDRGALDRFVGLIGPDRWARRLSAIRAQAAAGPRVGRAVLGRHAIFVAIERLRRGVEAPTEGERQVARLAAEAVALMGALPAPGRRRLQRMLRDAAGGDDTLVPLFHLLRTARLQRRRGYDVRFSGLCDEAPYSLLIARDGAAAEVACEVFSAELGRQLHRGAWFHLADRIDPDLQSWLAAHPGRYLLRVSLPDGLQDEQGLARLHARIREMLSTERRSEQDAACVLRLDRLLLAGAQASELGLMSSLRREFGPDAHLAVTTCGEAVFAMAARAGREDEIARAVCRRMEEIAPTRFSGRHPGILAMFIDDIERQEWRGLRERLELEGEARQFLTRPEAAMVAAVAFASRMELFGTSDSEAEGELRFRNPAHKAARAPALAGAIASSV
ncbi:MAG TPA: hypothetical protein VFA03_09405 [Acetobacteraceae bacterium]|nr:hypothetical protein [Acetobacteraceae bacterium]